jgi:hypothetical protein
VRLRGFQALGVRGLPHVLEAIGNSAHQPHPETDGRVPAGLDDAVEVFVAESFQELDRLRGLLNPSAPRARMLRSEDSTAAGLPALPEAGAFCR